MNVKQYKNVLDFHQNVLIMQDTLSGSTVTSRGISIAQIM